ncbi:steroid 17-alpha-hydroxylase/17,20 lyase-like [Babylonia areolata]|uniref:steroid 17-alpha-hydroxylase/17,20 lyase-like n=1 Tax=Babylonia areolata TaxID=304850 RepID=UPI003FD255F0
MDVVRDLSARAPGTPLTQALLVGALVGVLSYYLMRKRYRLPPGPLALPLLGNLVQMRDKSQQFYVILDRWARERYGPVLTIYLGPVRCVMLNDFNSINEALVQKGEDYAGRPFLHSLDLLTEGSKDIAFTDYSPAWKLHRRIAVKAIRHYLTGPHLDTAIHKVMAKVTEKMAAEPGPFDPFPFISSLMFHILDFTCFGEEKPYDDPSIQRLINMFDEINSTVGNGFFEDVIPLLKYWPTKTFRRATSMFVMVLEYYESKIQEHRQSFSPDKVRDMTDSILLAQMEAAREERAEVMAMFTDVHVRQTISDLFGAGSDTSRYTLTWALLYVAGHPEVQRRAQEEIDGAVGTCMPSVEHRPHLHYTQAVLQETMRMAPVVPMSLPHKSLCDTTVGGYDVPKNTMVMVNLWAVMHDPDLWEEPDQFRPERFLDDEGKLKPTPKTWMPFSAGRRACLGESVSKPELLLLLANFLKRFTISLPEGQPFDPSVLIDSMNLHVPKPYKIVVTPRS